MTDPAKRPQDYDGPIRLCAKAAMLFATLAVCLYWMSVNETISGVSQWGKVERIYRATDPQRFALSHARTLIEAAAAAGVAVVLVGYMLFCMTRRQSLRHQR